MTLLHPVVHSALSLVSRNLRVRQSASRRLLSFRQTPRRMYVVLFVAVDAGSVGFAIHKIHSIPLSKGVGCLDTALFSSSAVKVELGWCALMSSAQLSLESHLCRDAAEILAVVRSCSMLVRRHRDANCLI